MGRNAVAVLEAAPQSIIESPAQERFRRKAQGQAARPMRVLMMERPQQGDADPRDVARVRLEFGGGAVELEHPYLKYMVTEHYQENDAILGLSSRAQVRFRFYEDQVKQELWLHKDPGTNVFDEILWLENLSLVREGDGWTYNDARGIPVGSIPVPVVRAFNVQNATLLSTTADSELISNPDGSYTFRITVDRQWLTERFAAGDVVVIDPTTVATSSASTATRLSNQRKVARFSNGVLFGMYEDSSFGLSCRYSADGGSTWQTPGTGASIGSTFTSSVFIDADDYIHVVRRRTSDNYLVYNRGTPDAGRTSYTWSADFTVYASDKVDAADIVAVAEGTGWKAFVVFAFADTTPSGLVYCSQLNVMSGGSVAHEGTSTLYQQYIDNAYSYPSISIDANKNLLVVWTAARTGSGYGVRAKKATYSAGSWSWGSEEIVTESYYAVSGILSGQTDSSGRFLVAFRRSSDNVVMVYERSSGGTWTDRSPSAITSPGSLSVATDTSDNIYLAYTLSGLYTRKYNRGGAAWDAAVQGDSATSAAYATARRDSAGNAIDVLYTVGSGSPYTVTHYRLTLNSAPTAPTLTTKANFDATSSAQFTWTFNDPDAGNTQGSYQLQIARVSDGVTVVDSGKTASGTASHTLTGGTLSNNVQYQWRVKTWDQSDLEGPYSNYSTFYTSAKPSATITVPATDGATVTGSSLTAQWTYSDPESEAQFAYQVRLTDNSDVEQWSSGKKTGANLSLTIGYTLVNSTNYKVKLTVWDAKDVASTEVVRTFVTSFTAPATPTIAVVPLGDQFPPRVDVKVTNPAPGGGQPSVTNNTIQRSSDGGSTWTTLGTCDENGTLADYTAASGTSYIYRATANGSNGVTATSATKPGSLDRDCWWFVPKDTPSNAVPFAWNRDASWQYDMAVTEVETRGPATVHFAGGKKLDRINISAVYVDGDDATPHQSVDLTKEQWRQRFKDLVLVQGYLCGPNGDNLAKRGILQPPSGSWTRDMVVNALTVAVVFVEKGSVP